MKMTSAEKIGTKVEISIFDLEHLADCLAELDGLKSYAIATRKAELQALVSTGMDAIQRAAGPYASAIYCNDHEPEPA